ncbi:MAG: hypothetical protein U0360_05150 [Dehalococcoidia bacterium]
MTNNSSFHRLPWDPLEHAEWLCVDDRHQRCFGVLDSDWPVTFDQSSYNTTLGAGASTSFIVKVTLSPTAPLGCQNETATVNVTVGASA